MGKKPNRTLEFFERYVMVPSAGCRVWPFGKTTAGYGTLSTSTKPKTRYAHVAACERWHGPRPEGMEVAHSCGNPSCWAGEHLRWATHQENLLDRRRHQTMMEGEGHYAAKVTEDNVREIRDRAANGEVQAVMAREFGVSQVAIHNIIKHKSWKHV
jgi:hypothetical protein